jgi:hypothetical protein
MGQTLLFLLPTYALFLFKYSQLSNQLIMILSEDDILHTHFLMHNLRRTTLKATATAAAAAAQY